MGTSPLAIPLSFESTKFPSVESRLSQLTKDRNEALAAHELARRRMIDRFRSKANPFTKGQLVWLESKHLKTNYPKKLSPKREGPFKITEVLGPLTYRLELPKRWKIHNTFHATLLTPFSENDVHGPNFTKPPPDLIEGEEHYEVEAIRKHRKAGRGYSYLVKWKDYPTGEETWEPASSFTGSKETLDDYRRLHKLPPYGRK
jgi:hypothetical protein